MQRTVTTEIPQQITPSQQLRLFVAVTVPDSIKDALCGVQRELQELLSKTTIRWTPREQIHLTLRFFGNVRSEDLDPVKSALQNVCKDTASFRLHAYGLGVFPEKRFPRVIWVGVRDDQNQIGTLQRKIETATAQFGEKPDDRPFSAHLSLGRVKDIRSREAPLRDFVTARAKPFGDWHVGEIELIRSELSYAGVKHSVVARYTLRAATTDS